jgi:hypothetical protein
MRGGSSKTHVPLDALPAAVPLLRRLLLRIMRSSHPNPDSQCQAHRLRRRGTGAIGPAVGDQ